jgi:hypothetical protein
VAVNIGVVLAIETIEIFAGEPGIFSSTRPATAFSSGSSSFLISSSVAVILGFAFSDGNIFA